MGTIETGRIFNCSLDTTEGVWRGKNKRTTRSREDQKRATDLVKGNFTAKQPNHLCVADFTYIQTNTG